MCMRSRRSPGMLGRATASNSNRARPPPACVKSWCCGLRPRVFASRARPTSRATLETLVALHRVEWEPRRAAWGEPFSLTDEMARLDNLLDRPTLDPKVAARAPELRERLRATLPRDPRIGCVHGDFQWSNCLYDRGRLVAVIDWELAQTGAVLLDLGWLCLFSDSDSWVDANLLPVH